MLNLNNPSLSNYSVVRWYCAIKLIEHFMKLGQMHYSFIFEPVKVRLPFDIHM